MVFDLDRRAERRRTLHYAGPNATDGPRRALIMAFQTPTSERSEPRDFYWQRPEWHEGT